MIGDINWSVMLEGGGQITGTTSFDIDDVCWSRIFKPDSGGGGGPIDDGGSKPFDQLIWDQIVASTKTGKYKTFSIGQMAPMDLGDFGTVHMQIAGIDKDILADGSGNAALSLIVSECFGALGSGEDTYLPESNYYNYLHQRILPLLPQVVRDNIKAVTKYTNTYKNGTLIQDFESSETIWAPSFHEIRTDVTTIETKGVTYSELFTDNTSRRKIRLGTTEYKGYFLRSAYRSNMQRTVTSSGSTGSASSSTIQYNAVFGFCL